MADPTLHPVVDRFALWTGVTLMVAGAWLLTEALTAAPLRTGTALLAATLLLYGASNVAQARSRGWHWWLRWMALAAFCAAGFWLRS